MEKKIINNNLFFEYVVDVINSSSGGSVELPIKGVSMQPTLVEFHDRVILTSLGTNELFVGAIALFKYKGKYLLHRLVRIESDWLIFQGDNIHLSQERVKRDDVVAIVESIIKGDNSVICTIDVSYQRAVKTHLTRLKIYNTYFKIKRHIATLIKLISSRK